MSNPYKQMLILVIALMTIGIADIVHSAPLYEQIGEEDYTIVMNCEKRSADLVMFVVNADQGNAKRSSSFRFDDRISRDCQQTSTDGYSGNIDGAPYHRSHYLAFNTRDDTDERARATNVTTNIVPMTADLNTGVYFETETLTECYREIDTLHVFTGPIWGENPYNDFFVESHGVPTPDFIWKLIYSPAAGAYIAWIFPNKHDVSDHPVEDYQVTFTELYKALEDDKPHLIGSIPWPAELMLKGTELRDQIIDWPYQRSGQFYVVCQGRRADIG